jgi:multicomponent Na+:H+ antiporter subunit F
VLVVLAIVGFVGSVVIARFVAAERAEEARILTKEELRQVLAQQNAIDDEAAPVHDPDAARAREAGVDPAAAGGPVLGLEVEPEEAPPRDGEMGEGARGVDR